MGTIWTICWKDLRLLLRDRAGLFFTFAFPVVYALFFGAIFSGGEGGDRRIPIRLVDLDQSAASAAFLDSLAAGSGVEARRDSLAGAEGAVRRGKAAAALIVKPGFGARQERPFGGDPPEVELLHDPARQAEAGLLQGLLMEEAFRGLQRRFEAPRAFLPSVREWRDSLARPWHQGPELAFVRRFAGELDRFLESEAVADSISRARPSAPDSAAATGGLGGFEPLRVQTRELKAAYDGPQSSFEISFPQGMLWGVLSVAASFGISLVVERKEGTLRRLRAAPLRRRQILAGKALACFGTIVALCLLMLAAGRLLGVRAAHPAQLAAAVLATAAAFTGLMLLISVLGKTERAASGIGWSLMTLFAMLGGGMVPLFFMPEWMRTLGTVSPVKWAILALEGALWRGFGWAELLPVLGVLLGCGVLAAAVGLRAFRWSEA